MSLTPEKLEAIFRDEDIDDGGGWVDLDEAGYGDRMIGLDGRWDVGKLIERIEQAVATDE